MLLMYPLEWPMPKEVAAATLDFYAPLTDPDGPAMTDSVHAIDAAAIGEPGCATYTYLMRTIRPFVREPFAQFAEARGAKAGVLRPPLGRARPHLHHRLRRLHAGLHPRPDRACACARTASPSTPCCRRR